MDKNKVDKLKEIGYSINPACGLCIFSRINPNTDWGTCKKFKYTHKKHTGDDRELSVNRYGSCEKFEYLNDAQLEHYREFNKC